MASAEKFKIKQCSPLCKFSTKTAAAVVNTAAAAVSKQYHLQSSGI
jgi:hypothetical protein